MSRTAVFAGTFDPVTSGHLDVVRRAATLFDELIVCVAREGRATLFPVEERVRLLETSIADRGRIRVEAFSGLLVAQARRLGARVLVRGVRGPQDLESELQMAYANRSLAPEIDTVFLVPSPGNALVSSTLVREVARLGGDVSAWVPPAVAEAIAGLRATT
jgi:pantetheine-phosphate adenylyltransferase